MGRPSKFSEATLESICAKLMDGEPLAVICRAEDMPSDVTVRNWMKDNDDVTYAIAHARAVGFDTIAHNVRLTARKQADSTDDVQRDKLIIETDLKLLAKWDPKKYGDMLKLGGDSDHPLQGIAVSFVNGQPDQPA